MKNTILYLTLFAALLSTACSRYEKDIFGEDSSHRVDKVLASYQETLCNAENGWNVSFFPNPEKYGAFSFVMKFYKDNTVQMWGDSLQFGMEPSKASLYTLYNGQGPVLKFDTYTYLHVLADPVYTGIPIGTGGKGWEGDIEFVFEKVSADTLVFFGKKRKNKIVFVKNTLTPQQSIAQTNASISAFLNQSRFFKSLNLAAGELVFMGFDAVTRKMEVTTPSADSIIYKGGPIAFHANDAQFYTPIAFGADQISTLKKEGNTFYYNTTPLVGIERPSFKFPKAYSYLSRSSQPVLSSASPAIAKALKNYEEYAKKELERNPQLKGFVYYDFRFIPGLNIKPETPNPKFPDAFCSTIFDTANEELWLYDAFNCKMTQRAEDEVLFTFSGWTFGNKYMKAILTPFYNEKNGVVVVPSSDYQSFTLVTRDKGEFLQLDN